MIVAATHLTARYPGSELPALREVDCRLAPGELLAVVGPNGGGKTTLLRALLGLIPLERGSVTVAGRDRAAWSRAELSRIVGVVGQREENAFPLRVQETVMLGRYAHLGPLASATQKDRDMVWAAMERCDVLALRDRPTDTLSGGEWQRVRIARALAQHPQALLLDEPTASLDVHYEMEVLELVARLVTEGLGALVITHHLNLAARYATRMLLLAGGRVVAEGTPAAVLTEDVLARVFRWPLAVTRWSDGSPQVIPLRPGERVRAGE